MPYLQTCVELAADATIPSLVVGGSWHAELADVKNPKNCQAHISTCTPNLPPLPIPITKGEGTTKLGASPWMTPGLRMRATPELPPNGRYGGRTARDGTSSEDAAVADRR